MNPFTVVCVVFEGIFHGLQKTLKQNMFIMSANQNSEFVHMMVIQVKIKDADIDRETFT